MSRFVRKGHQAEANAFVPLPVRDGVAPSYLWVTEARPGACWPSSKSASRMSPARPGPSAWRAATWSMRRGERLDADSHVRQGMRIWYYRELEEETPIPFEEQILFQDEHLLVVDKPHFLPMIPTGRFLRETLLVRLKRKLELPHLTPIHRLDRETAGVVIFSHNLATRGTYQSMFQKRVIRKTYEALAPVLEGREFPFTYRSRMVDGEKFFVMKEEEGEPNSETVVELIERRGDAGALPPASAHGPQAPAAPAHGLAGRADPERRLLSGGAALQGRRFLGAAAAAGAQHRLRGSAHRRSAQLRQCAGAGLAGSGVS
jgi:tRNA pseudouridine32 synthase/23S rRNA pseudouridine746 synthase